MSALLASFKRTAWYAYFVYATPFAAAYGIWRAFIKQAWGDAQQLWRKARPLPAPPSDGVEPPTVVLGRPSVSYSSLTRDSELAEGETRSLVRVAPQYLIENQDPSLPIRDVTTGVRARGGRSHTFDAFYAPLVGAGREAPVTNVEVPKDFLEDVHESAAVSAFLYWARFTRQRVRWEVVYDPNTRQPSYAEIPMPKPELTARVWCGMSFQDWTFVLENTGDVRIEQVDCELAEEATNWGLMTDVLPSWPLEGLDPGERREIPLGLGMGPFSVEVTLRGRAEAVPYERKQVVSSI
jgi:hypothetical protein